MPEGPGAAPVVEVPVVEGPTTVAFAVLSEGA